MYNIISLIDYLISYLRKSLNFYKKQTVNFSRAYEFEEYTFKD